MTVHGAKGLEAPLVILDRHDVAAERPAAAAPARFAGSTPPRRARRIESYGWAARRSMRAPSRRRASARSGKPRTNIAASSTWRLTRAADRLIVAGCEGERQRPKGCWYDLVLDGLRGREGFSLGGRSDEQIWRDRKVADTPTEPAGRCRVCRPVTPRPWPDWLRQAAPVETETAVAVTPIGVAMRRAASERFAGGGETRRKALARGVLVHRLTQSLPDIAARSARRGSETLS